MHHLIAYTALQAISATEVDCPAVADPCVTRQNGHPILPSPMKLLWAYAQGVNLGRARINAPSLRRVLLPYIWPLTLAANPPTDPNVADFRDTLLTLPKLEEIEVDTTNTSGAATDQETVGLCIGDGDMSIPTGGDVFTVRCTAAITAGVLAWTSGPITFGQSLPTGRYALINAQVQSATAIFARFILAGWPWRPGVIGSTAIGNRPAFHGDKNPYGVFFTFENTNLPQLDVFCSAADTAQVLHLDLIKVA